MIKPISLTLRALLTTHCEYDPVALETVADFYKGGWQFEKKRAQYLRKRKSDANDEWRLARLECAYYSAPLSGKVDGLIGGILRNCPKISVTAKPDDARATYWHNLNANANGLGKDLTAVSRDAILQEMLPARSYLVIKTPQIDAIEGESTANAKARKRLDCSIGSVDATQVDDWQCNDSGFEWIRTHYIECTRADGIGPVTDEEHTWTYYEATQFTVYKAKRPVKNGKPENWPDLDKTVIPPTQKPHSLGIIPIIPVDVPDGFDLGGRLVPIAKAHYNRESTLAYSLDCGGLSQPVITSNNPVSNIFLQEQNCIKLEQGGTFEFVAPDGTVFTALTADAAKLRSDLDSALASMADQAKDRTSGVAQQQFREPKEVLMSLFAMPMVDALQIAVNAIAKYRGEEDLKPTVSGLDEFDTQSTEVVVASTAAFCAIPEQPKVFRKKAILQAAESFFGGSITPDELAEANDQLEDMPDMIPAMGQADPVEFGNQIGQATPKESILNKKTNAPQGMGADQIRQSNVVR